MRTALFSAALVFVVTAVPGEGARAQTAPYIDPSDDETLEYGRDYGHTLSEVEAARAAGEYQRAADRLRGFLQRWGDSGELRMDDMIAIQARMREYVALRELLEQAAFDSHAAARYLAKVTEHVDPSARSVEQSRALTILAKHDPRLARLLARVFPARVAVAVSAGPQSDEARILLSNAIVDLTRDQPLQLRDDDGAGSFTIVVDMRENDRHNSLLEGTLMRSYAVNITAELTDVDGHRVVEVATTTAVLGINVGNAAKGGMSRVADRIFSELMAEIARRVDRGDLP